MVEKEEKGVLIMAYTIAVTNHKGGVGKSSISMALFNGLNEKGYKCLFVDMDSQANSTYALGADPNQINTFNIMTVKDTDVNTAIQTTVQGDVIAGNQALAAMDTVLTNVGKEFRLREALASVQNKYDFIVLDTPPALGVLTINALTASDGVVVPTNADIFSLQGIDELNNTIRTVQKYCNPNLRLLGMVLNQYNPRTNLTKRITEMLDESMGNLNTHLYGAKIRSCNAIREAAAFSESIFNYAPTSNASLDLSTLVDEVLDSINEQRK